MLVAFVMLVLGATIVLLGLALATAHAPSVEETGPRSQDADARARSPVAGAPLAVPSWAAMVIDGRVQDAYAHNKALVDLANKTGTQYDFVLYGDSITQRIAPADWRSFFGSYRSAHLGVGGTTVEELAWRLMLGGEKFAKPPRLVAVLIGINNLKHGRRELPKDRLEYLLRWVQGTHPGSRISLLSLLPNAVVDVFPTNAVYAAIARHLGVAFVDCTVGLDAKNKAHFGDGTHPSQQGYRRLFECLSKHVESVLVP